MLLEEGADALFVGFEGEVAHVELDGGGAGGVEARSVPPGPGLVDLDGPAVDLGLVHLGDGDLGGRALGEGDEAEAATPAGGAVLGQEDVGDLAELGEEGAEARLVGIVREVAEVEADLIGLLGGGGGTRGGVAAPSGGGAIGLGGRGLGGGGGWLVGHGWVQYPKTRI